MPNIDSPSGTVERPEFASLSYVEGSAIPEPISDNHLLLLWNGVKMMASGQHLVTESALVWRTSSGLQSPVDDTKRALRDLYEDKLYLYDYSDPNYADPGNSIFYGKNSTKSLALSGLGIQVARNSALRVMVARENSTLRRRSAGQVFNLANPMLVKGIISKTLRDPQPI